jgi:hypothetical protein
MRQHTRKGGAPGPEYLIDGILRDEIAADVFELWVGVSRLMARMRRPQRQIEIDIRARRASAKKVAAARRSPRRKAA